jgi:hypothetical protein
MRDLALTAFLGLLLLPGMAEAQSVIRVGETVRGRLTADSPKLRDDSYYRCFQLQTEAGQWYRLSYESPDFDTFLSISDRGACSELEGATSNDDGGQGSNSRIDFQGNGKPWLIRIEDDAEEVGGAYTLSVVARTAPAVLAPTPIAVGQTLDATLAETDYQQPGGGYQDCYVFTVREGERVRVTMRSRDFNSELALYEGGGCLGVGTLDDNGGGGYDAQITTSSVTGGTYSIRARSSNFDRTGSYRISVEAVRPPQ